MSPSPPLSGSSRKELVLLTHGIASTRLFLLPLAWRLQRSGFATRLYGYPSVWWSNRSHGQKLASVLHRLAPRYERVHLVVHSMGAIVTRCALEERLPDNLGRVVMIAPPNRGSHVATRLAWSHGWFSPTLLEIRDTPESFVNSLGAPPQGVEIGVLEASRDRVLRRGQTHLEGQADHRTVTGWHTHVLWTRETARVTERFLREGAFGGEHEASPAESKRAMPSVTRLCPGS